MCSLNERIHIQIYGRDPPPLAVLLKLLPIAPCDPLPQAVFLKLGPFVPRDPLPQALILKSGPIAPRDPLPETKSSLVGARWGMGSQGLELAGAWNPNVRFS